MSEPDFRIVQICPNPKWFKNSTTQSQPKFKFEHNKLSEFYIQKNFVSIPDLFESDKFK